MKCAASMWTHTVFAQSYVTLCILSYMLHVYRCICYYYTYIAQSCQHNIDSVGHGDLIVLWAGHRSPVLILECGSL